MSTEKRISIILILIVTLATIGIIVFDIKTQTQQAAVVISEDIAKDDLNPETLSIAPMPISTTPLSFTSEDQRQEWLALLKNIKRDPILVDNSGGDFAKASPSQIAPVTPPASAPRIFTVSGSTYGPVVVYTDDDTWLSYDGTNYSNIAQVSAFGTPNGLGDSHNGRIGHQVVYFKNRVWIFGGYTHLGVCENDVWSSPDGLNNWRRELDHAPWAGRAEHTVTLFNGALYLIGGFTCSGNGGGLSHLDDIWKSTDGISWTKISARDRTVFPPRAGHTAEVFNGEIYVMGGFNSNGGYRNDVMSSSDGIVWKTVMASNPWATRANHTSTVFNGKLYVIGGMHALFSGMQVYSLPSFGMAPWNGAIYNDVWSSTDGKNWKLETSNAAFGPRGGHSTVVFKNAMMTIGGSGVFVGPNYIYDNAYVSTNGSTWTKLSQGSVGITRTEAAAVVVPGTYSQTPSAVPSATTLQATSTQSSVALASTVPASSNLTGWFEYLYYVNYQASPFIETAEVPVVSGTPQFNHIASGLPPQTILYYRPVFQNKNGLFRGAIMHQQTAGCNPVMTAPWLNILYPLGGETFTQGQQITVTWETCNFPSTQLLDIVVANGWGTLALSTLNDGNEIVQIPSLPPGKYSIYIRNSVIGQPPADYTNSTFTVQ